MEGQFARQASSTPAFLFHDCVRLCDDDAVVGNRTLLCFFFFCAVATGAASSDVPRHRNAFFCWSYAPSVSVAMP